MLMSAGLPVSANAINSANATNKDVGVHTKVCLNVRHRVVSPARIAALVDGNATQLKILHKLAGRKNCVSRNQAQTLSHERVTRQPPTLDCGSTSVHRCCYWITIICI